MAALDKIDCQKYGIVIEIIVFTFEQNSKLGRTMFRMSQCEKNIIVLVTTITFWRFSLVLLRQSDIVLL